MQKANRYVERTGKAEKRAEEKIGKMIEIILCMQNASFFMKSWPFIVNINRHILRRLEALI